MNEPEKALRPEGAAKPAHSTAVIYVIDRRERLLVPLTFGFCLLLVNTFFETGVNAGLAVSVAAQMASRVEKRTALALLFFRMDRFARVMSTFSASWERVIFRWAITTSRLTTIMPSRQIVRSFSAFSSAARRNSPAITRHKRPAMVKRGMNSAV